LIDGVELFEKVKTLRKMYAGKKKALAPIEAKLAEFRARKFNDGSLNWTEFLAELNTLVNTTAEQLAK
jgi:hypothetical protein